MKASETIKTLATALSKAQGAFPAISKTHIGKVSGIGKNGPYEYSYNYADLADTVEACKGILSENGISFAQFPDTDGNGEVLTTRIMHASGQWLEASMSLMEATTPQAQGSLITYARRYALCAALGIVADEDDDAQSATGEANANGHPSEPRRLRSVPSGSPGTKQEKPWGSQHHTIQGALYGLCRDNGADAPPFALEIVNKRIRKTTELSEEDAFLVWNAMLAKGMNFKTGKGKPIAPAVIGVETPMPASVRGPADDGDPGYQGYGEDEDPF